MASKPIVAAPHILLPRPGVDLSKYAVIACDQFTSQPEYWRELENLIKDAPSTLRMIFPEAYLGLVDTDAYIKNINATIASYLNKKTLVDIGAGFVLVDRSTPYVKRRLGLMLAIDLESYSFDKGTKAPIRASEATIVERIPPRLKVRENASVELPHVLVLFDDPSKSIIESLYNARDAYPLVYDFELNQAGGHIRGYHIKNTATIIDKLQKLTSPDGLLFIVGDGNHSLATAKAHWDKIKMGLPLDKRDDHPARYSLVEAINIYDDGLQFEPIHRIVFNAEKDFMPGLAQRLTGPCRSSYYSKAEGSKPLSLPQNSPMAYKIVQDYVDGYIKNHPGSHVDYIHGIDDLCKIADGNPTAVGLIMPTLTKGDIFEYIAKGDVLPRKCFSMGHAVEKRYYLEAKSIK